MSKEKEYCFSYNCQYSCKSPTGMKTGHVSANNKTEARVKIKLFLEKVKGELCMEWF